MIEPTNTAPIIKLINEVSPELKLNLLWDHASDLLDSREIGFVLSQMEKLGTIDDIANIIGPKISEAALMDGYREPVEKFSAETKEGLGNFFLGKKRFGVAMGFYQMLPPDKREKRIREAANAALEAKEYIEAFHGADYLGDLIMMENAIVKQFEKEKYGYQLNEEMMVKIYDIGKSFMDSIAKRVSLKNPILGVYLFLHGGSEEATNEAISTALQQEKLAYDVADEVYDFSRKQNTISPFLRWQIGNSAIALHGIAPELIKDKYKEARLKSTLEPREFVDKLRKTLIEMFEFADFKEGLCGIVEDYVTGKKAPLFEKDVNEAAKLYDKHELGNMNNWLYKAVLRAALDNIREGDFWTGFKAAEMINAKVSDIPLEEVRKGISALLGKAARDKYCIDGKYKPVVTGLRFIEKHGKLNADEEKLLNYYGVLYKPIIEPALAEEKHN